MAERAYVNEGCMIQVKRALFSLDEDSFLNDKCMVIAMADVIIGKNVVVGRRCSYVAAKLDFENWSIPMMDQGYAAKGIRVANDV
jgi:acetyltransferase-like isoleucine patch superfamily enzyme